jgi:hypothetical protein
MTRSACSLDTIAPMPLAGSSGSPGAYAGASAATSSTNSSCTDSSTRTRECAEQTAPWLNQIPAAVCAAVAARSSTSAKTRCGLFPPHSSQTCFMFESAAYRWNSRPTSVEPVNARQSTSGCRPSARPVTSPVPGTTFSTPSGIPASAASSAMRRAAEGDCSAGLSTTQLPAASAGATFQASMSTG